MRNRDLEVARTALRLGRRYDAVVASDVAMLLSVASSLQRLNVIACQRELTEEERSRRETLRKQAYDIAVGYMGAQSVFHQSDPRGYPMYLIFAGDIPTGQSVEEHYFNGVPIAG